jgi:hypothetical protein
MTKSSQNYGVLLCLALLFIAPGFAAYIYFTHPSWIMGQPTNRGVLLSPPERFLPLDKTSHWRLVFLSKGGCHQSCMQTLSGLAKLRLALGRRVYDIDLWLIMSDNAAPLSKEHALQLKDWSILAKQVPHLKIAYPVGIVNPQGLLVMTYPEPIVLSDIDHDIRKFLHSGSGF